MEMLKIAAVSALLLALPVLGKVMELDDENYASVIEQGNKPVLVEWYAPWCGHCQNLAPEWKILEDAFASSEDVIVAKIDADKNKKAAAAHEISGFPHIRFYWPHDDKKHKANPKGKTYNGDRNAVALANHINNLAGTKIKVSTPTKHVMELNSDNFYTIVGHSQSVFVKFFAPWCGHCKKIAADYDRLAASFVGDDNVIIAEVNGDEFPDLTSSYDIKGYPSLRWFPANSIKNPEDYSGSRNAEDFVKFVNNKINSKRTVGGGFEKNASLTDELKDLILKFKEADESEKASIIEETRAASANVENQFQKGAKFYHLTMQKLLKDEQYLEKEEARLLKMLEGGERKIAANKIAEFHLRISILNTFKAL